MSDINWAAAAKYIAGEGTASERAAFEAWMRANPDDAQGIMALAPHVRRPVATANVDVDTAWIRLSRRMDETPFRVHAAGPRYGGGSRAVRLAVASAIAATIVIGAVLSPRWLGDAQLPQPRIVASTGIGEREDVVLRDGSRATLAPQTQLREYVGRDGSRNVVLSGEALFTVKHADSRFIVHAGSAAVEDLGTAFTVRARPEQNGAVEVAVTEGSVALRAPGADELVLRAGESGGFADGRTRRGSGDVAAATAWTRGRLVFDAAPLSAVGAELERWHPVDVRVDSAIAARTLTASFAGETIDQIANAIAATLDVRYHRSGDTLVFSAR